MGKGGLDAKAGDSPEKRSVLQLTFNTTSTKLVSMRRQTTFGQRLRELRKAKNLTQRELADAVSARLRAGGKSFDFTYLSKIENDKTAPPSVALITELANVLKADANELITLAGKAPPAMKDTLRESESARAFFRSAFNRDLTDDDWKRLSDELNRKKKARENPPKSRN
jgi:transcriptional regulator with XRE-family HTH domain